MFVNAVNVKQSIYFLVRQVTDQLFEFRLYTVYSRVLKEFKRFSIDRVSHKHDNSKTT